MTLQVIYEDEHVLATDKPPGCSCIEAGRTTTSCSWTSFSPWLMRWAFTTIEDCSA